MSDVKLRESAVDHPTGTTSNNNNNNHNHNHTNNNNNNNNNNPSSLPQQLLKSEAGVELLIPHAKLSTQIHPLHRPWTLWYDSVATYDSQRWELSLVEVMTVRTVEEFFTMLHYCKPPHVLRVSAQYHFFREGVKPMWEDPNNKAGGKLWISLDEKILGGKKWESNNINNNNNNNTADNHNNTNDNGTDIPSSSSTNNNNNNNNNKGKRGDELESAERRPELDVIWENVLMALVGEYLDPDVGAEHVMGVVLSKRKYHNRLALWLKDASATEAVTRLEQQLVREAGLPTSAKFIFTPHGSGK